MQFAVKLIASVCIIIVCAQIGRKVPSLAGLIATMPLMSLIVLLWLHSDNPRDTDLMILYTRGALWGIVPSILFYVAAYACFRRHLGLPMALIFGFSAWLIGALAHQQFIRWLP
ncbi:MAG: DUF3147 family protein [Candidatus Aureabacteria bacterium]|nr:DUF3147 family protein [Candidatus Auribacterota bacterium]